MAAVDPEHDDLVPLGDGPVATVLAGIERDGAGAFAVKVFPRKLDRRTKAEVNAELDRLKWLRGHAPVLVADALEDVTKGRCALRMELCAQSLPELLGAFGPLPVADALALGHSLATALAAAHQAGFAHGGVTPGNVLFRPSGEAVLSDFGLVLRRAFPADPINGVEHLPPETIRDGTVDERSDLYGLGIVLYLSLTGRSPHQSLPGEDAGQRVLRVLSSPAPPVDVPEVPGELRTLIADLIKKNPDERPVSAVQVLQRLHALLGPPVAELPGHPGTSPAPPAPDADRTVPLPADLAAGGAPRAQRFDGSDAQATPPMGQPAISFDGFPPAAPPAPFGGPPQPPAASDRLILEFGPNKPRRNGGRTAFAVAAVAAVGGLALATTAAVLLLLRGPAELSVAPDEQGVAEPAPTLPDPRPSVPHIELDEPVDQGTVVQLSWRGDRELDYAVIISAQGERNDVVLVNDKSTYRVRVDPTRQYCFAIQGTDGSQVVESAPRPVRDAACTR